MNSDAKKNALLFVIKRQDTDDKGKLSGSKKGC